MKPPRPPAAPTNPVTAPTDAGGERRPTRAKTAPLPTPSPAATVEERDRGRRDRQLEGDDDRTEPDDREGRREHARRAHAIGEHAAHGTGQGGQQDEAPGSGSSVGDLEAVDLLQVGREVHPERDETTEGDGVEGSEIEGDPQPEAARSRAAIGNSWGSQPGASPSQRPRDRRGRDHHDRDREEDPGARGERRDRLGGERRDGRAEVPHAVDPERGTAPRRREPGVDERDPDRERGTRDTEQQRAEQQRREDLDDRQQQQGSDDHEAQTVKTRRPPCRSVRAPRAIRATEPRMTGTATSNDTWSGARSSRSR
jgi:hypothetical protein